MEIMFLILLAILIIALTVLVIAAVFCIFRKFGEKGWFSLIPVYNTYVWYKHCWGTKWFFIWLASATAGTAFFLFSGGKYVENLAGTVNLYTLLQYAARIAVLSDFQNILPKEFFVISVILWITASGINLVHYYRISRSFDHGADFGVGLFFLPFVFLPILGFRRSEVYIGPDGVWDNTVPDDTYSGKYM